VSVYSMQLSSPPADIDTVHDMLADAWAALPTLEAPDRIRFETAFIELASNIMRHADNGAGVSCTLRIEHTGERIEATLLDNGKPGNVTLNAAMPDDFSESGYGIPLVQALVDDLEYHYDGARNRWRISSRLPD
jgi:serine/threonine-protein kinase RsbW